MSILSHIDCIPIFTPQKTFRDSFGRPNAFLDMNPSLHIHTDGSWQLLVRRVNYRKFCDKSFTLYQNTSHSSYGLFRGTLFRGAPFRLEGATYTDVTVEYGRPTYNTYWTGPEDIRFLDAETVLATVPECNPTGQPCIFQAKLNATDALQSRLYDFQSCEPSVVEKNWMPFVTDSGPRVIYSVSPLCIKDILTNTQTITPNPYQDILQDYHGSTNGISLRGEYVFLIHKNIERTYHRFLFYNPLTKNIRITEPFFFFPNSYIEFPCSLAVWNERIFISLGVNDDKAFILEISESVLYKESQCIS